jgi:GR25 family glycosyltransferase involved in LPS biosynthesis
MSIRYYLIHCDEHVERLPHITKLKEEFNQEITVFKGIATNHVHLQDQHTYIRKVKPTIKLTHFKFWQSGQIGCYLSHIGLMEHIMLKKESDYSVIFEDDVVFDTTTLHANIEKIIQHNVEFDILFLGNNNENKGEHIVDNIYHVNNRQECWGLHGLLIHNKNIDKILNVNYTLKHALDVQYLQLNRTKQLTNVVVQPILCCHANLKSNM